MTSDQPFLVNIPDSDLQFTVRTGQSIVDAAAEHGVEILTGCTNGQCGTCLVKILEGEVEHRDKVLTPEKRAEGWMCACVSRATTPELKLELW